MGRCGHFFRLTCSVVLWGGRKAGNKYHWRVWGVLTAIQPHWVCPCSWPACFPSLHCSGSRLLCWEPRCPSADEWIRKLWYIYTIEYYSAIKKNTLESVLMRWMKLEPIIQSEVSQKEKHRYSIQYTNAYIWNL